jgi:hypothetical protein
MRPPSLSPSLLLFSLSVGRDGAQHRGAHGQRGFGQRALLTRADVNAANASGVGGTEARIREVVPTSFTLLVRAGHGPDVSGMLRSCWRGPGTAGCRRRP